MSVIPTFDFKAVELTFSLIDGNLQQAQATMQVAFERAIQPLRNRILSEVRPVPPPASQFYPLKWKSKRQERYVKAKLAAEGNLPYQRGSQASMIEDSWFADHILSGEGGSFIVGNTSEHAVWVIGQYQQPMFDQIGWIYLPARFNEYRNIAEQAANAAWFLAADPFR